MESPCPSLLLITMGRIHCVNFYGVNHIAYHQLRVSTHTLTSQKIHLG